MKKQKGQSVVEFALVLPFLLGIILGIVYFGLVFSDYLALNSLARTISRDVSLYEGNSTSDYRTYIVDTKGYTANDLPNRLYRWDPNNSGANYLSFQNNEVSGEVDSVKVTLTARADTNGGFYSTAASVIGWAFGSDAENNFRTLQVEYTMRKENGRK